MVATVAYAGLLFIPVAGPVLAVATGVVVTGSVLSVTSTVVSTAGDIVDVEEAKRRIHVCKADHKKSVDRLNEEAQKIDKVVDALTVGGGGKGS